MTSIKTKETSLTKAQPAESSDQKRGVVRRIARDYGIYVVLASLVIYFSLTTPVFATQQNFFLVLRQVSVIGIIAIGATFVILTAGIDLSVGSMLAVAGLASGFFAVKEVTGTNVGLALVLPLLIGLGLGALIGSLVAYAGISPLIVTLGALTAFRGLATWLRTNPISGFEPWYRTIGTGRIGPVPIPVIILLVIAAIAAIVLNKSRFGRHVYAIGGNEEAARASGVNVEAVKVAVYMISGFLVGVAAVVFNARIGAAQATAGQGMELAAIAAVVVGGTSIFGGRGKLFNTIVGVLIIGVLFNGLVLKQVSFPIQQMVIGSIIVAAVWMDMRLRKQDS